MRDFEKPVPSTDEISCSIYVKPFLLDIFGDFKQRLLKVHFSRSITLVIAFVFNAKALQLHSSFFSFFPSRHFFWTDH